MLYYLHVYLTTEFGAPWHTEVIKVNSFHIKGLIQYKDAIWPV